MMETKQKYFSPECEVLKLAQTKTVLTVASPVSMNDPYGGNQDEW